MPFAHPKWLLALQAFAEAESLIVLARRSVFFLENGSLSAVYLLFGGNQSSASFCMTAALRRVLPRQRLQRSLHPAHCLTSRSSGHLVICMLFAHHKLRSAIQAFAEVEHSDCTGVRVFICLNERQSKELPLPFRLPFICRSSFVF